jgi:hypothetical protein
MSNSKSKEWHLQSSPTAHLWRRRGERRYSSFSFTTSALEGGEWSASLRGHALSPGKGATVPIVQEARWATQKLKVKSFTSAGNRIPDVQSVVRHYNDCATTASKIIISLFVTIIIIIIIVIIVIIMQVCHW